MTGNDETLDDEAQAVLERARELDNARGGRRWKNSEGERTSRLSRWRRSSPIVLVVVVVFAAGPWISRSIDAYRAVVLEAKGGETLIMEQRRTPRPPRWISVSDLPPGAIVEKRTFDWSPVVVPPTPADAMLTQMFARWDAHYEGAITQIRPPYSPGAAHVATVQTEDGRRVEITLAAEHLATAAVGDAVRKTQGSWDPVLLPRGAMLAPSP